jgi:hypothetical protein
MQMGQPIRKVGFATAAAVLLQGLTRDHITARAALHYMLRQMYDVQIVDMAQTLPSVAQKVTPQMDAVLRHSNTVYLLNQEACDFVAMLQTCIHRTAMCVMACLLLEAPQSVSDGHV